MNNNYCEKPPTKTEEEEKKKENRFVNVALETGSGRVIFQCFQFSQPLVKGELMTTPREW